MFENDHKQYGQKQRLEKEDILVAPGAFDMVSAKAIEYTGLEALDMTGFGQSASHLAFPGASLMTMNEMAVRIHHTSTAVNIPIIADEDTGYGKIVNAGRTITKFERFGASAIQFKNWESL